MPSSLPRAEILVVDDDPPSRFALSAVVATLGLDVATAESGFAALNLAVDHDYAAILLDAMMPGLDGFATLERLRSLPLASNTPVLFTTAMDHDAQTIRRAYTLGAMDFLAKPIDPDILLPKLHILAEAWQRDQVLRSRERLFSELTGDVRAPLSTIASAAERLLEHDDPSVRVLAGQIGRAATRVETAVQSAGDRARSTPPPLAFVRRHEEVKARSPRGPGRD